MPESLTEATEGKYDDNMLKEFQIGSCREASAPTSPSTSSMPQAVADVVDTERHGLCRRGVGQLQWQARIRPDIAFTDKELARPFNGPVEEGFKRLKHLLRYIKGL